MGALSKESIVIYLIRLPTFHSGYYIKKNIGISQPTSFHLAKSMHARTTDSVSVCRDSHLITGINRIKISVFLLRVLFAVTVNTSFHKHLKVSCSHFNHFFASTNKTVSQMDQSVICVSCSISRDPCGPAAGKKVELISTSQPVALCCGSSPSALTPT